MNFNLSRTRLLLLLPMFDLLCGCKAPAIRASSTTSADPVLIVYHVQPGKETALKDVIRRAWQLYQREGLVLAKPHVCVEATEDSEHVRLIELFSWVSALAIEHPPDSVSSIWKEMQMLCEDRGGNKGVEVRRVKVLP